MNSNTKQIILVIITIIISVVIAGIALINIWKEKVKPVTYYTYDDMEYREIVANKYLQEVINLFLEKKGQDIYELLLKEFKEDYKLTKDNITAFLAKNNYFKSTIYANSYEISNQGDIEIYTYDVTFEDEVKKIVIYEYAPYDYKISLKTDDKNNENNNIYVTKDIKVKKEIKDVYIEINETERTVDNITFNLYIENKSNKEVKLNLADITNFTLLVEDMQISFNGGLSNNANIALGNKDIYQSKFRFDIPTFYQGKITKVILRNVIIGGKRENIAIEM